MKGKIMNSQTSTNQTKAQPDKKTAERAETNWAMKHPLKIKNDFISHSPPFQLSKLSKSPGLATHCASDILGGRTGRQV